MLSSVCCFLHPPCPPTHDAEQSSGIGTDKTGMRVRTLLSGHGVVGSSFAGTIPRVWATRGLLWKTSSQRDGKRATGRRASSFAIWKACKGEHQVDTTSRLCPSASRPTKQGYMLARIGVGLGKWCCCGQDSLTGNVLSLQFHLLTPRMPCPYCLKSYHHCFVSKLRIFLPSAHWLCSLYWVLRMLVTIITKTTGYLSCKESGR